MEATIQEVKPFASKEHYYQYRAAFKALAHAKALTAQHMMLNNAFLNRDLEIGFSPITNPKKIANGNQSRSVEVRSSLRYRLKTYYTYVKTNPKWAENHKEWLKSMSASFGGTITDEMWEHAYQALMK